MTGRPVEEPVEAVVQAVGVGVRYGQRTVLDGVSVSVPPGTELSITGRSGSGKTSLLLVLAGLLTPQEGSVAWPGLSAQPVRRRGEIGLVFQAPSLLPDLTCVQNVALPLRLRGHSLRQASDAAHDALEAVGLLHAADVLPAELSGGMAQRTAAARVLAGRPRLVLADEPTGALDRESAFGLLAAMRAAVASTGGALVLATHDEELAALLPATAVLDEGRLLLPEPA